MKWPIWGMPVAVFDGATTGTPRRWAMGVCRKGLLGEGGSNQGQHTSVDLQGEGRVGGGLVAAAVLQAQGHGFAVDAAAAIDRGKGQVEACALVLAVDIGVASQRQHGPNWNPWARLMGWLALGSLQAVSPSPAARRASHGPKRCRRPGAI